MTLSDGLLVAVAVTVPPGEELPCPHVMTARYPLTSVVTLSDLDPFVPHPHATTPAPPAAALSFHTAAVAAAPATAPTAWC